MRFTPLLVLGLLVLACLVAVVSCGSRGVQGASSDPHWHTEARSPGRQDLPPDAPPGILELALPEVKWTGDDPRIALDAPRSTVAVYADDTVSFDARHASIPAEGSLGGLQDLLRWWRVTAGEAPLWPPDSSRIVELYVDRAASWARVRAVLAFLAGPPHGVKEVSFAVWSTRRPEGLTYVAIHLGMRYRGRFMSIQNQLDEEDGAPEDLELLAWREGLGHLPDSRPDGPYVHFCRGRGFAPHLEAERSDGGSVVDLGGTVIRSPGSLGDVDVVAAANEVWTRWERYCLSRRGYGSTELPVREGYWRDSAEPGLTFVAHVPAAYVVKLVDFQHAEGKLVKAYVEEPLRLEMPVPARMAQQRPASPLPLGVALAAIFGVALAFVSVFGVPHRKRARAARFAELVHYK